MSQTRVACVQTSPLPQKKSEEETTSPLPIFPEGGGTSVHRLKLEVNSFSIRVWRSDLPVDVFRIFNLKKSKQFQQVDGKYKGVAANE